MTRPRLGLGKKDNAYARAVDAIDAPKRVWMAIAFALASQIDGRAGDGDWQARAADRCFEEWRALFENQIVMQKPRRDRD